MPPVIPKEVLSLGDEVGGEEEVAVDGVGDVSVALLMIPQLLKLKMLIPLTTKILVFSKEVPSHGDVVDGVDAVVVGDGENKHLSHLP